MTKEEAIKYLKQLTPNGGHCWLDKQRIEAIGMAVKALQEEPVSEVWYDARKSVPENSISQIICIKEDGLAIATEGRIVSGTIKWAYLSDLLNLDNSCNFEKNLQKELVSDIDFEQELYKAFGQVKDFTLGMRIAKWFYDMGKNNQEPVSEGLEEAAHKYANIRMSNYETAFYAFMSGAKWHKTKDESTTEDLGEYINELSKQFPEVSFAKLSRIAVRVAKWQKEEDDEEKVLIYKHGFEDCKEHIKEALLSEVLPCFMHGGEADEVVAKLDDVLNQKK